MGVRRRAGCIYFNREGGKIDGMGKKMTTRARELAFLGGEKRRGSWC